MKPSEIHTQHGPIDRHASINTQGYKLNSELSPYEEAENARWRVEHGTLIHGMLRWFGLAKLLTMKQDKRDMTAYDYRMEYDFHEEAGPNMWIEHDNANDVFRQNLKLYGIWKALPVNLLSQHEQQLHVGGETVYQLIAVRSGIEEARKLAKEVGSGVAIEMHRNDPTLYTWRSHRYEMQMHGLIS